MRQEPLVAGAVGAPILEPVAQPVGIPTEQLREETQQLVVALCGRQSSAAIIMEQPRKLMRAGVKVLAFGPIIGVELLIWVVGRVVRSHGVSSPSICSISSRSLARRPLKACNPPLGPPRANPGTHRLQPAGRSSYRRSPP